MRKTVVIGFLGTTLDRRGKSERWKHWRPSIAACQHDEFLIDRYEMLRNPQEQGLAIRTARDMSQVSPETELRFHDMMLTDPWDFGEVYGALHDFALTYDFKPEQEDYLIQITTGTHVAQICLFLLTESRHLPGRLLQLSPSKPYSFGAPGTYRIIDLDLSKYDQIASRSNEEATNATSFLKAGIKTREPAFNALIDEIERVAIRSDAPILLTGPTGAGKTQLARRIFELKKSRHLVAGGLVEINCATLRGDQAMSTLFGHKKGSFTGALSDRDGLLKAANGGILFLDEIGELGLDEQAMLLVAIEEGRFMPVGADKETSSEFLLIAGTNRDLGRFVQKGRFREDLLARINLWRFKMPGLAERRADIEPNLAFELERFSQRTGEKIGFNKEASKLFLSFALSPDASWRGNFRDLSAAITRMATLSNSGRISRDVVEAEISRLSASWQEMEPTDRQLGDDILSSVLSPRQLAEIDPFDKPQLVFVIQICRNSKTLSEAGRNLFSASRKRRKSNNDADRLRKYLTRFKLDWQAVQEGKDTHNNKRIV